MSRLKLRYDREIDRAERSVLRKITEKDEPSSRQDRGQDQNKETFGVAPFNTEKDGTGQFLKKIAGQYGLAVAQDATRVM